jgi:TatD DNase family protein
MEQQIAVFTAQLQLAKELDRCVSIHGVAAYDQVISCLKTVPGSRALLHAFSGSSTHMKQLLALGCAVSFCGKRMV